MPRIGREDREVADDAKLTFPVLPFCHLSPRDKCSYAECHECVSRVTSLEHLNEIIQRGGGSDGKKEGGGGRKTRKNCF